MQGAICELNLTLDHEKDEKEKMLVRFRQELATKQQEIDSLKRLSQDMTAISTAQEISLLQNDNKPKPNPIQPNKHCGTLPKIVGASEKRDHKSDNVRLQNNKYNYMVFTYLSIDLPLCNITAYSMTFICCFRSLAKIMIKVNHQRM